MTRNLQGNILRMVEQKTFRRIGGVKDIQVDVRIITATNKDLLKLMEERKFREDLFYRINVASIKLLPLRERADDVLPLTKYFVQKYNEEFHKNVRTISKGVETFLREYSWPGNVRELKNVIERAMILVEEEALLMEHLPIEILGQASKQGGAIEGIGFPT